MRDYARIIAKINQTNWLITPEGLDTILMIVQERLTNGRLDSDEIDTRLASIGGSKNGNNEDLQIINGVGILPIQGPIFGKSNLMTRMSGATSLQMFQQDLRAMLADDMVSSIIMDMDTPGGTSDLVEEVGNEIFAARKVKPIYASVNTTCGSAGLWLASQANKIFSTPSGSIGSLGVYTVHQDQSGADAKDGVKFSYISAGDYKTEGNPHEALSAEARQHRQESVNEVYDQFVNAVAAGRGLDAGYVKENFGKGRMLTASKAKEVGMTDGTMSFDGLLNHLISSLPRPVSVTIPGNAEPIAATMIGDQLTFTNDSPEYVSTILHVINTSNNTTVTPVPASIRREDKDMKLSAEVLKALGLSDDASDEQINAAITSMNNELSPLRDLRAKIDATNKFSEMFPEEHKRMMDLEKNNRMHEASNFAKGYRDMRFSDVKVEKSEDGEKEILTKTTKGLSGLALQKIENTFMKGIESSITIQDFKETLDAMMTGIVDYNIAGKDVGSEPQEPVVIRGSSIKQVRQMFADKVVETMKADNINEDAAIKLVGERFPDLAEAYKVGHVPVG